MYKYKSYGLNISSEIRMPGLTECDFGKKDVKIKYGDVDKIGKKFDKKTSSSKTKKGYSYYVKNIGGVKVEGKKRIVVSPENGAKEKGFHFLVSGIALGLLLHKRGFTTLHASAVALGEGAVGFIGPKGAGKSTTAAALYSFGNSIVTDDLLVLKPTGDEILAYPGLSHLKLYPSAIKGSLKENPNNIPKIDPSSSKRSYSTNSSSSRGSIPLHCLYVLGYKDDDTRCLPRSEKIGGKKSCIEIIRHTYVPRIIPSEATSVDHFNKCAKIAERVSVRHLYRKKSVKRLPSLARFVRKDNK